ncbi:MAG: Pr6Pr family membrane protein [Terrimesophilobacter sp.]
MIQNVSLAFVRLAFALLGFVGLIAQYLYNVANIVHYQPVNFFSFFTVQSNIIAVGTLAVAAACTWRGQRPRWLDYVRGAATIYMVITGITYSLLLRNVAVDTAVPWVNLVLHYVLPIVMIVDWMIDLPQVRISVRSAMIWLVYPVLYLAYSLIRGPIVDWYPYPFLDPRPSGYGAVVVVSLAIALGGLLFAVLASWTTSFQLRVHKQDAQVRA